MLKVINRLYDRACSCVKKGVPLSKIKNEQLFSDIIMMKYSVAEEKSSLFQELIKKIDQYYNKLENVYEKGAKIES